MKQFLILIAFAIINVNAKAQSNNEVASIQQLKVTIQNGQLLMNWQSANEINDDNFEIQASLDGKTFTTIGYVMGSNPKGAKGTYTFKQTISKMKAGFQQFRVLQQLTTETALASEAIGITK